VRSITVPSFVAETSVDTRQLAAASFAGLVVYGDRANHLALVTDGKTIQLWLQRKGARTTIAETGVPADAAIRLRVSCVDGDKFRFAVQEKSGTWKEIAAQTDGSFLPPWDRGVRTGVYVAGPDKATGSFDYFTSTAGTGALFTP
jgi:xylan 1,4-beta-xylosidase